MRRPWPTRGCNVMIHLFLVHVFIVWAEAILPLHWLRVFENKVVRKIRGSLRDETKGQLLQDLFSLEDSVWVIKISKMT